MSTINRLSSVDVLQPSDQIPVWDSSNGDTRKASMSTLLAFVESYFADPDYSTRIVAPNADYFNVDIGSTGDSLWMIVNPTLDFSNGTLTLPPASSAVNDQEITVVFTKSVLTLVIASSGATILGAPTQVAGYDSFRVRYNASQATWYTLDTTGTGAGGGVSQIVRQDFTGDGATTTFVLDSLPLGLGNQLQIFIDGVYQERASYTVTGSNLIFGEAPPSLSTIEVLGWTVSLGASTTANLVAYSRDGSSTVTNVAEELDRTTTDNMFAYELSTTASFSLHPGIATGYIIRTNYFDSAKTSGSGAEHRFTGTTTAGKAGNWPDADGYFYDADGKQFAVVGSPVNALVYGCVYDGADDGATGTDNYTALQGANDYCETVGASLYLSGAALIKAKLSISCPWIGEPGFAKLIAATDFVPSGVDATELDIAIKNKSFSATYNAATANLVNIRDIDFIIATGQTGLRLGNVKGGLIENCNLTTATTSGVGSLLDLFAVVKNLTLRKVNASNSVVFATGGACWIRNIAADGSIAGQETENILVDQCEFSTATGDEALAVYGVRGVTQNVTIRNTKITGLTSTQKHGTLASTFPLDDGSAGGANAAVRNILWDACTFVDGNFTNDILRFGLSTDTGHVCEDVRAVNCKFYATQDDAGTSYVMRNIPLVGDGNAAIDCTIDTTGSVVAITYGIGGFPLVSGATVLGACVNAVYQSKVVQGCPRLEGTTGVFLGEIISNNYLYTSGTAVNLTSTQDVIVSNNIIDTDGAGVAINTLGGATAPRIEILGNTILMSAAASFAVLGIGALGRSRVIGNKISGTGKSISGSQQYAEIANNDWFGNLDSMRTAGYLDYDHNRATPIGTFAVALTHTAGANSYLLGFIKTANASISSDWKTIYAANALT